MNYEHDSLDAYTHIRATNSQIAARSGSLPWERYANYCFSVISIYAVFESFCKYVIPRTIFSLDRVGGLPPHDVETISKKYFAEVSKLLNSGDKARILRVATKQDLVISLANVFGHKKLAHLIPEAIGFNQGNFNLDDAVNLLKEIGIHDVMTKVASSNAALTYAAALGFAETGDGIRNAVADLVERRNVLAHQLPDNADILGSSLICGYCDLFEEIIRILSCSIRGKVADVFLSSRPEIKVEFPIRQRINNGTIVCVDCCRSIQVGDHLIVCKEVDQQLEGIDILKIVRIEYQGRALKRSMKQIHPQVGISFENGKVPAMAKLFFCARWVATKSKIA